MLYTPSPPVGSDPVSRASIMKDISEHSQIVSVANASARNALASQLAPTMTEPLWVYRQDLDQIESTVNGTSWRTYTPGSYGAALKTSNQPLAPGGSSITFVQLAVGGGITWSSLNGGGLKVSLPGTYLLSGYTFLSGGTGRALMIYRRWRAGSYSTAGFVRYNKDTLDDHPAIMSAPIDLLADDIITLHAEGPTTMSAWGDGGSTGTRFSLHRIG